MVFLRIARTTSSQQSAGISPIDFSAAIRTSSGGEICVISLLGWLLECLRTNNDSRYFTDTYQSMPAEGYAKMFEAMIDNPRIALSLNTTFEPALADSYTSIVYTGPIDEYFDFRFGKLPYRSIRFEHRHLQGVKKFQAAGTINYPDMEDGDYTRITEFKYLTGQLSNSTSIVYEYPSDGGAPSIRCRRLKAIFCMTNMKCWQTSCAMCILSVDWRSIDTTTWIKSSPPP